MPGAFTYGTIPSNNPKGSSFQSVQPVVTPTGVIHMFAGATAPNGWLICDGSLVSRVIYSDLFKVIGTTYGVGDSNTTFALPDLRGRSPIGVGTGAGLTARVLGTTYGAESVTLASNQIPTLSTGAMSANSTHSHTASKSYWNNSSSAAYTFTGGASSIGLDTPTTDTKDLSHTHSITNASQQVTSILHPALAVNYIIKT